MHISAEFRILKRNFEQLIADHKNGVIFRSVLLFYSKIYFFFKIIKLAENERVIQYSKEENEILNKKLKVLIRRHQEAIKMNEHMVELFLVNIFSHFVSAALVLCCVSVNLLLVS